MNIKALVTMLSGSILLASTAYAQQSTGSVKGVVNGANTDVVVEDVDNSRGVTKSKTVDADGALPDDDYGKVRQFQAPRSLRLSARVQWR